MGSAATMFDAPGRERRQRRHRGCTGDARRLAEQRAALEAMKGAELADRVAAVKEREDELRAADQAVTLDRPASSCSVCRPGDSDSNTGN